MRVTIDGRSPLERVPGLGYRGDDAEDAWRRIDAPFDEHLRAG